MQIERRGERFNPEPQQEDPANRKDFLEGIRYRCLKDPESYDETETQQLIDLVQEEGILSPEAIEEELQGMLEEQLESIYDEEAQQIIDRLISIAEKNKVTITISNEKNQKIMQGVFDSYGNSPTALEKVAGFAEKQGIALNFQATVENEIKKGRADNAMMIIDLAGRYNTPINLTTDTIKKAYTNGIQTSLQEGSIQDADELFAFGKHHGLESDLLPKEMASLTANGLKETLTHEHFSLIGDDSVQQVIGRFKQFSADHKIETDFAPALQHATEFFVERGSTWQILRLAELTKKSGYTVDLGASEIDTAFQNGLPKAIASQGSSFYDNAKSFISLAKEHGINVNFQTIEISRACQSVYSDILKYYESDNKNKEKARQKRAEWSAKVESFTEEHNIDVDFHPAYVDAFQFFLVHSNYDDPEAILELANKRGLKPDFSLAFQKAAEEIFIKFQRSAGDLSYLFSKARDLNIDVDFKPPLERVIADYVENGQAQNRKVGKIIEVAKQHGVVITTPDTGAK